VGALGLVFCVRFWEEISFANRLILGGEITCFAQDFLDGCFLLNELPEGIIALGAYIKSLFIMGKGIGMARQHEKQSHTHVSVF
jgi:hypothetical protein